MEEKFIIIVAGGKGLRMGGDIPKQFMLLGGRPVLMHTIENFYRWDSKINIILVLPEAHQNYWKQLCDEFCFRIPHKVASGGETRFHSVLNGLKIISANNGLVGVHDGVRPLVSHDVLTRCYESAVKAESVVPVVKVVETVREIQGDGTSFTRNRDNYRLVQTPQVFNLNLLREAYSQPYTDVFTDDASVVEAYGHPIMLVEGNRENIKLTTPEDMVIAEALIKQKKS